MEKDEWKKMNICFIMSVWMLSLASCGDDIVNYTMENTDEALCGKLWIDDSYVSDDGFPGTYQLRFFEEGDGQEITAWQVDGGTNTFDRNITWRWTDSSKECLQLTYPDGTSRYLENVWVREHYLSAQISGRMVVFVDANYQH